jgi:hypothetical protein
LVVFAAWAGAVLPIPPFEELRPVVRLAGIVDRAAEDIEHAPIDGGPATETEFFVQALRIGTLEVFHPPDPQIA